MKNILSLFTGRKSPIDHGGPPSHIGEYSVVKQVGAGATSNVFLGVHGKTFATVAIKLLRRECQSDMHRHMFATEASLCGAMDHPNIVTIHKADLEADEGAYLVMEYIEGESMDHHAKPDTLLPIDFVIDAIRQAAEALKHASGKGIVHRDIKPDNLVRSPTGHVKLTDFGCAITNKPNAAPIPVAGSVAYMSPEQLTGKPLDFRSDLYALAAVFYRLLTGYYSFDAFSADDAVQKILKHPHVPLESRRQGIPPELTRIIDKALEKSPDDRHASWDEFIGEIESAQITMRSKYDYDYDMLRGFCDLTMKQFLADQHADMQRGYCDLDMERRHTRDFELPSGPAEE